MWAGLGWCCCHIERFGYAAFGSVAQLGGTHHHTAAQTDRRLLSWRLTQTFYDNSIAPKAKHHDPPCYQVCATQTLLPCAVLSAGRALRLILCPSSGQALHRHRFVPSEREAVLLGLHLTRTAFGGFFHNKRAQLCAAAGQTNVPSQGTAVLPLITGLCPCSSLTQASTKPGCLQERPAGTPTAMPDPHTICETNRFI